MDIDNSINFNSPVVGQISGDFLSQRSRVKESSGTDVAKDSLQQQNASEQQSRGQEQVEEAVSRINDYVQNQQRTIRFSIDESSGKDVVTVLDKRTEEIIRQMPREEILVVARRLAELQDENFNLFNSLA
jgi:flagellar protein FlaG